MYPYTAKRSVKITYRYGNTVVPNTIRNACVKLVVIDLLSQDDRTVLLPEGTDNLKLSEKIEGWRKDIDSVVEHNAELLSV